MDYLLILTRIILENQTIITRKKINRKMDESYEKIRKNFYKYMELFVFYYLKKYKNKMPQKIQIDLYKQRNLFRYLNSKKDSHISKTPIMEKNSKKNDKK